MNELSKAAVLALEVGPEQEGQRIDNYLIRVLKGVPKSRIYRMVRSGEVRVNSRRVDATCRLQAGDRIRVPPVRQAAPRPPAAVPPAIAKRVLPVIHEDDELLVIDKPAGTAVHGGSGVSHGVVEQLRAQRPQARFLELVHRLDRDTSGVLVLAKKRSALVELHRQLREGEVEKHYSVLVLGRWHNARQKVSLPLHRHVLASGERRVRVSAEGLPSRTIFTLERSLGGYSLLDAELKTGRTHQIRVHLAHLGFPIAGDEKYGDYGRNRELARAGLKRMFLHARRLRFMHPATGEPLALEAPLPPELADFLAGLGPAESGR